MAEYADYIELGREARGVEYKRSQSWEDRRLALTKTVLAMANTIDGGIIVIGMRKEGESYVAEGVEPDHLVSFKQDDITTYVNERTSSPVELSLSPYVHEDKTFLLIQVSEFAEFPIICTRDGHSADNRQQLLRRGALYIRSRRRVESAEVSSEAEMREVLRRAIDKGLQQEIGRLRRLGFLIGGTPSLEETNRQAFDSQLEREGL